MTTLAALLHETGTCDSPRPDTHNTHMGDHDDIVNACEYQATRLAERGVTLAPDVARLDVERQNDHDELAAMVHGRNDHEGSVCDGCSAMADYLVECGVRVAPTLAPDAARLREAVEELRRYVKTSRSHPTTFRAGLVDRIDAALAAEDRPKEGETR